MNSERVALVTLGICIGMFVAAMKGGASISAGEWLGAAVTVIAALVIQLALTRRAEINRVPLDAFARLFGRVNEDVDRALAASMDADPGALLMALRGCALELHSLNDLFTAIRMGSDSTTQLFDDYYAMKYALTGHTGHDDVRARAAARSMRLICIRLQLAACRHVLEHPEDIERL